VARKRNRHVWYFDLDWHTPIRVITRHFYVQISDMSGIAEYDSPRGYSDWADVWYRMRNAAVADSSINDESSGPTDRSRLFVTADAPTEVIVAAFRALAKIHHPDVGGNPDAFKLLQEAYDNVCQNA